MDPFYSKVDEIKKNIKEKNYELSLSLYSIFTETYTEPYHEYEIKRLSLDKLMNQVSKKFYKTKLDENLLLCQTMINNNNTEQAKIVINNTQKIARDQNIKFSLSQRIKIAKLEKEIRIPEDPLEVLPEPELEEVIEDTHTQNTVPEFDEKYFKETSKSIDTTLKQNGYSRIKIIPESIILSNIYNSFDHLYYKTHKDGEGEESLLSLVFLKIESSKGNINLRYPEVDYKTNGKLSKKEKNLILNNVVHFPIRIFKHLLNSMEQKDYDSFKITTEIFEDLFVKVFPRAEILQHPLRVKSGAKQMEIDAHGIILLKKSLYQNSLPGLRSDHIYFLIQDNLQKFINFQDTKYFAYISAKKELIENYESPKQKHVFFGRQSKIGFIITPILLLSAIVSFFYQDLLTPFLIIDLILTVLTIGHGIFQRIFGESELYRISKWHILSRNIEKWDEVFRFIPDEEIVNLISSECANFSNHKMLREPKKFSIPFLHNLSLKAFLKRKKLQKCYIDPATTLIKSKSRALGKKIKQKSVNFSSIIKNRVSPSLASKSKIKIKAKRKQRRLKSNLFTSNNPKLKVKRKIKSSSAPSILRNSIKLNSINSFLED